MALPEELAAIMTEEVILEPAVQPPDKMNKFTYGVSVTVDAYIVRANKRVINRMGRETTSTVQAILADPDLVVSVDDRITLPDGTQPAIIEVNGARDEEGNNYWLEVRC
jgi:hypothetical protein